MIKVLRGVGILFILVGIIFGMTQISDLMDQYDDVKYWEEAAEENYDNSLIEDRYLTLNELYKSSLIFTFATIVSSIVSGIFFLALATIIDLLQKLVRKECLPSTSE
ncbi:hypothetical protein [Bacillus timonensis]|uniref:hypothetical protein n=1 Tax=Bacillus timonensis TaxID=1033734 RepID=UPI000289A997|nr:hypothetical protein [Bacillus timonensis]